MYSNGKSELSLCSRNFQSSNKVKHEFHYGCSFEYLPGINRIPLNEIKGWLTAGRFKRKRCKRDINNANVSIVA